MVSINEIIENSKRSNYEHNKKTHPIEMAFSPYLTWLFVNLKIKPNTITVSFFIIGMISAFLFSLDSLTMTLFGFILYRFHLLLDVCDGEVARFTKQYSDFGKYADLFTHQLVYPSVFAGIIVHIYNIVQEPLVLVAGIILVLIVSFRLSINSIVYRVNYNKGKSAQTIEAKESMKISNFKKISILFFANITGFHFSFFLFFILKAIAFFNLSNVNYIYLIWYYLLMQLMYIIIKLYFVFKNNRIPRRDSLY